MPKEVSTINTHAQQYIAAVFEQTLRQEGFSCPDSNLLCWYRVRNRDLLDTVIFCSSWSKFPLMMEVYYESIPLFSKPLYIRSVKYNSSSQDRWDCHVRRPIREMIDGKHVTLAPYSNDIWVEAPLRGGRGLYTLTEHVLPYLQKIQTVEDCYRIHKQSHSESRPASSCPRFHNMSRSFMDEALYVNDQEVIPCCHDRIIRAINTHKRLVFIKPNNKSLKEELSLWQELHNTLSTDGRAEYMNILQRRKEENIDYLHSKLKVDIQ